MKNVLVVLIIVFFFASCGDGYGNQIVGGNLTVYYSNSEDIEIAKKLANFWKEKNLLTGEQQDIQLARYESSLSVRLIAAEGIGKDDISFEDIKTLLQLRDELAVLLNETDLKIEICKDNFKPITVLE